MCVQAEWRSIEPGIMSFCIRLRMSERRARTFACRILCIRSAAPMLWLQKRLNAATFSASITIAPQSYLFCACSVKEGSGVAVHERVSTLGMCLNNTHVADLFVHQGQNDRFGGCASSETVLRQSLVPRACTHISRYGVYGPCVSKCSTRTWLWWGTLGITKCNC